MTDRPAHRLFAALYDPVTALPERALFAPHREALAADCSGRVLDLGAGTGAMVPALARAAERTPGLAVHAVEPDPHMRRRARERAAEAGLAVDLVAGDAAALPYRDDAFDHVVAALVLCTVPDLDGALSEVARVLRPGGDLRVFEHVHGDGWYGRLQSAVAPAWRAVAAGCHLDRATDAVLRDHDAFAVASLERVALPTPPAAPYVRGRLVRRG